MTAKKRKSRIPDSVQIGPYTIEISQIEDLTDDRGRPAHGCFCFIGDGYKILINQNERGIGEADTYLHELIEATVGIRDLKISHSAIQTMATDLAQALYPKGLPPLKSKKKK